MSRDVVPMEELGRCEIARVHPRGLGVTSESVVHLSDAHDPRWAGVHFLPPNAYLRLDEHARHDVYVLQGALIEEGVTHPEGTFSRRDFGATLNAGVEGATLFRYRDRFALRSANSTVTPCDRDWQSGSVVGMAIAALSQQGQSVALVSWSPGTRVELHEHPRGEEIFVIDGALCDGRGRHPAGTWQRFHPDTGHSPYTEEATTILLRNGHLVPSGGGR